MPMNELSGDGEARPAVLAVVARSPVQVAPEATLRDVARAMADESIGAVLVHGRDGPVGIVSERDVVGAIAAGADPDAVGAAEVMTPELATIASDETVLAAANRMLTHDIRHLVVEKGAVTVGLVSIRDVLAVLADRPGGV